MTDTRRAVAEARRLVVKVGSSSLTTVSGGLDVAKLDALVDAVAARAATTQVVLVSSGAIAAGLAPLGLPRRPVTSRPSRRRLASGSCTSPAPTSTRSPATTARWVRCC